MQPLLNFLNGGFRTLWLFTPQWRPTLNICQIPLDNTVIHHNGLATENDVLTSSQYRLATNFVPRCLKENRGEQNQWILGYKFPPRKLILQRTGLEMGEVCNGMSPEYQKCKMNQETRDSRNRSRSCMCYIHRLAAADMNLVSFLYFSFTDLKPG